jgi:hypothetical protein
MIDTGRSEPGVSWCIYLLQVPSKWLGTVEAATAEEAVKIAAKKFGEEPERVVAASMDETNGKS